MAARVRPDHEHLLERIREAQRPEIDGLEPHAFDELGDRRARGRVVADDRDRHRAARALRVDHLRPVQRVERFDDLRARRRGLNQLGVAAARHAVIRVAVRRVAIHHVRRVEDDLARQVAEALRDLDGEIARHREHDDVGAFDGLGLRRRRRAVARLRDEILDVLLGRRPRAVDDRVAERRELGPERRADVAGADDGDLRRERGVGGGEEQRQRERGRERDSLHDVSPFGRQLMVRQLLRPRESGGRLRIARAGSRRITAPSGWPLP